jgi:hypothetical protein
MITARLSPWLRDRSRGSSVGLAVFITRMPALVLRKLSLTCGGEHARTRIQVLVADRYIRAVDAETGELLGELTLDPTKDYQPLGRPPGPPKGRPLKKA